jgi:Xaa-Pro aminopeptidase
MDAQKQSRLRSEFNLVEKILADAPEINPGLSVSKDEFIGRQIKAYLALDEAGCDVGLVFSDEHYKGDVPYLGGNTNISIEQVAGAVGKTGFHILAGPEGGYAAEQLAGRAGAYVHKVDMLKLTDEAYPVRTEKFEDVLEAAAGCRVKRVALLTLREVIPAAIITRLEKVYGQENVVDLQTAYQKLKYEKSDTEMKLTEDAGLIADAAMRAMLAVLQPGMLETEVAAFGGLVCRLMGAEGDGFQIMVGSDTANRTLIGKALNRPVREGAFVHLGVSPQRDGLTACVRRSVIAVDSPHKVRESQIVWFDLLEGAYNEGFRAYCEAVGKGLPAKFSEQALNDYLKARSAEVSRKIGKDVELEKQKPYIGFHSAGYTECQECYCNSEQSLGNQIVTVLDVALRGIGDSWDDVIIPGFDYLVYANTLGKSGKVVKCFNRLPLRVQEMVGVY